MTQRNSSNSDDLNRRIVEPVATQRTTETTAQQGQGGSGSTMQQAKSQFEHQAGQATQQAKQQASQMANQAKSQASSQKERAAQNLGSIAQALHQTADQLRQQNQSTMAQYSDKAAQRVNHFSSILKEKNVNELIGEAERFARRQPSLFLGGAFALGLLGARFLKSSSQQHQG